MFLLRFIQLIITFFFKAYRGILKFLTLFFCGVFRIIQNDTKILTYVVQAGAQNIFHLEIYKDLSLVLFLPAYSLHEI